VNIKIKGERTEGKKGIGWHGKPAASDLIENYIGIFAKFS
jgi:hypothetical protein